MLKTGFARLDITPPLGTTLSGYFHTRRADGILDPLYASAVVFDNGEKRAVLMSLDVIGIHQPLMEDLRCKIANAIETEKEAVFVSCTHTHLGPVLIKKGCIDNENHTAQNEEYAEYLSKKLCDTAVCALQDIAGTEMYYTRGHVENVAFVRRYRMRDGSVKTNPPHLCPDIMEPLGENDESSSLLVLRREGKPEIGIINFQVHPDNIGGNKISADYPKFVRDTYESSIENSYCMYINGANGDLNNRNVKEPKLKDEEKYGNTARIGRKIAMSVIENYGALKPICGDKISFAQKTVTVKHNKGLPEEIADALLTYKIYLEAAPDTDEAYQEIKKHVPMNIPRAIRIAALEESPETRDLYLTALSVGDAVFAGFPGEPFTALGKYVKENSKFTLSVISCCANGYEGYYPTEDSYDGGYEVNTARYVKGSAEKLMTELSAIVNSL